MTSLFLPLESRIFDAQETYIYNVLKASLNYPTTLETLAPRLADDIKFFCRSAISGEDAEGTICTVWNTVFIFVGCIPPNNEWQNVWVNALKSLWGRPSTLWPDDVPMPIGLSRLDLPYFTQQLMLYLADFESHKSKEWKNMNSFAARLYASHLTNTNISFIFALRGSVEKYDTSAADVPEAEIWVVTEWLIRSAERLFAFLKDTDEPRHKWERNEWRLGRAFKEKEKVGLVSIERWNLWREWFEDFHDNNLDSQSAVDVEMMGRIAKALDRMNEAEQESKAMDDDDGDERSLQRE
ncbi:hypothetical protein F5Y16DRAFT_130489 [Xylariaceae sp. FL0255]|nr:hypothetical protein F5Y16DRAFT_130489 [Xylariaceae sp. FL0255]